MTMYSILDDGTTHRLSADAASVPARGRVALHESALRESLGWEIKPEGLCKGDVCLPVRDRAALLGAGGVDLTKFAELIGRPIVVDSDERVVAFGTAASTQAASMATLQAPDFELPDLAGRMHTLSERRGKKVLLIAYASW